MKTTEKTQTQEVKAENAVKTTDSKAEKAKKEPKVRAESNEAAAERMLKEKASAEDILAYYTAYYKVKGVTDQKFIEKRADIYMKIAMKKADAKKQAAIKK